MTTALNASISYVLQENLASYRPLFEKVCSKGKSYPRRTILSQSGKSCEKAYFLLEGVVKITTTNPNGYTRILGYHKRNTLFAMDCIIEKEAAVVTAEAVTPIRVLEVTWRELEKINEEEPSFYPHFIQYYSTVLRLMCFDAESKSIGDASARLAGFLCLYERNLRDGEKGAILLTQEDLASAVNASRVQIARICAEFKRKGFIQTFRGGLRILDREALIQISQYE